jgi:hypothetical protein
VRTVGVTAMTKVLVPKVVWFPQTGVPWHQKVSCEYEVLLTRKGMNIRTCLHVASVKVDGHPYCARHAGSVLIQILMEKENGGESSKGNVQK